MHRLHSATSTCHCDSAAQSSPIRADGLLPPDVPNIELEALMHQRLDVEPLQAPARAGRQGDQVACNNLNIAVYQVCRVCCSCNTRGECSHVQAFPDQQHADPCCEMTSCAEAADRQPRLQAEKHACVGVIVVISSSESFFRMVVLPALSRPSTRMRACRWPSRALYAGSEDVVAC